VERKLATVLFVDLVDSSALVSGTDPEVVRRRVTQYFERASQCIESHGGLVEKFAGDAVMAAFGIPQAHEDDAERGVRAALAIIEAVHEIGLEARAGVESGEVLVDAAESTFATGEPVNMAARLEQAAPPGAVLIGPAALRLTAGRVEAEPAGPLELRGLETVVAWRALRAVDEAPALRSLTAPLVGRDAELDLLQNTYERAVRDRRAQLFTVYGEAGVGKSRLVREFTASSDGATVLSGRCLPYGEGITYWPIAEMVKSAAGITDDDPLETAKEKLLVCCGDEAIAELIGLAAGVLEAVEGARSQQEIAWGVRQFAEELADVQPLIMVFEDIHWAEEPLLELIEHLAAFVRERPLMLLCLARPELLDVRSTWGGGRLRSTTIEVEPLGPTESRELADALLAEHDLPFDVRESVLRRTEGNPLFVEETIRMIVDEEAEGGIPDTLQALIAARIDRLRHGQKVVLQRAAVVGRIFWLGALEQLNPDIDGLEGLLEDLILRDFVVREGRSSISGEPAFRFKHVLIRDVAYSGLTKSARAELHGLFAGWLHERAGEELLEIRAYHLDQACALLEELDGVAPPELAAEAAEALETAGRRALARESYAAARRLLVRSVSLEPTLERRYNAARAAWRMGDLPALSMEMEEVAREASEIGNRRITIRALSALAETRLRHGADPTRAREMIDAALAMAELDDHEGRFGAQVVRSDAARWEGDGAVAEDAWLKALAAAQAAGRPDLEANAAIGLADLHLHRLEDRDAAPLIERALELAEESGSLLTRASALAARASLLRHAGDFEEAEALLEQALAIVVESGAAVVQGKLTHQLGIVAWRKRDLAKAERQFREAIRILSGVEDRGTLCESQRSLAEVLLEQGRIDEAERFALASRETVGPEDVASRATTRKALARVRAAQKRDAEAEKLYRDALDIIQGSDYERVVAEVSNAFARFLRDRGRHAEARSYDYSAPSTVPIARVDASSGDSEITVAGRSRR
jgi:class 3 adenylate cyclase/tetratricopeptide (TPR) repeat protein